MKIFYIVVVFLFGVGLFVTESQRFKSKGQLEILAHGEGTFELYEVVGESNLLFVSKQLGQFNHSLSLAVGQYLIFSDCSHELIQIKSNQKTTLVAHHLIFKPPTEPKSQDIFSVQCHRHEKSFYRQAVSHRFEFQVLDGHREMLIGMVPFFIEPQKSDTPKILEYSLSKIHFDIPDSIKDYEQSPYFISPKGELTAVTQPQNLYFDQFVLPGSYEVWLNGSSQDIFLESKKIYSIVPGFLSLTPPKETSLEIYTQIKGTLPSYEVNENYRFFYHLIYPLLPGSVKVRLDGEQKPFDYDVKPGQKLDIPLRSLIVNQGCSIHEWECLGKKNLLISEKDQIYPYLESYTDVPVIFSKREDYLSLEGTKGIKYFLNFGQDHLSFSSGKILIKPKWLTKHGYITDLVRIEAYQSGFSGHSDDISSDRNTQLSLLSGQYHLSRYTTVSDNDRFVTKQIFTIKPGETTIVEIPFYVSESKFLKFHQNLSKSQMTQKKNNSGETF